MKHNFAKAIVLIVYALVASVIIYSVVLVPKFIYALLGTGMFIGMFMLIIWAFSEYYHGDE